MSTDFKILFQDDCTQGCAPGRARSEISILIDHRAGHAKDKTQGPRHGSSSAVQGKGRVIVKIGLLSIHMILKGVEGGHLCW